MKKKSFMFIMAGILLVGLLSACGADSESKIDDPISFQTSLSEEVSENGICLISEGKDYFDVRVGLVFINDQVEWALSPICVSEGNSLGLDLRKVMSSVHFFVDGGLKSHKHLADSANYVSEGVVTGIDMIQISDIRVIYSDIQCIELDVFTAPNVFLGDYRCGPDREK